MVSGVTFVSILDLTDAQVLADFELETEHPVDDDRAG